MFGNKNKSKSMGRPEVLTANLNTIAKGTEITGDIHSEGIIRIDGVVRGKIRSKAKIAVGKSGLIEGELYCEEADIEGQVKGSVQVSGKLTIRSHGRVEGEINTVRLIVESGAQFSGTCSMGAQSSMPNVERKGPTLQKEAV